MSPRLRWEARLLLQGFLGTLAQKCCLAADTGLAPDERTTTRVAFVTALPRGNGDSAVEIIPTSNMFVLEQTKPGRYGREKRGWRIGAAYSPDKNEVEFKGVGIPLPQLPNLTKSAEDSGEAIGLTAPAPKVAEGVDSHAVSQALQGRASVSKQGAKLERFELSFEPAPSAADDFVRMMVNTDTAHNSSSPLDGGSQGGRRKAHTPVYALLSAVGASFAYFVLVAFRCVGLLAEFSPKMPLVEILSRSDAAHVTQQGGSNLLHRARFCRPSGCAAPGCGPVCADAPAAAEIPADSHPL
mmetsp:Transcript_25461/g.71030  ORF Transcript_25461/g.71030 Transcript_25461/m.71030 type:complete len:298 (-) Transcript_25461:108-1001(-)